MSTISVAEYRALSRRDFHTFMHRGFRELNPQLRFLHSWHNELIAAKLEACFRGKVNRLIINIPPRSLKSHAAAVAFPAYILGHNPSAQIICASYGQDLASKHSMDCRTLMTSAWYKWLFPTRLSPQKQSVQEFLTTQGGSRLCTSVGGVLTGRGADLIIIDDPLKPDEALSKTQRNAVNGWYDHTLYSRQNSQLNCVIIIIMQRLHEDDLVGHVLEQEHWDHVLLPAIAEAEETHFIETPLCTRTVHRHIGEPLHPEREPLAVLERLRRTIGEYNFAGQYQQSPAPQGGGMIKEHWFKTYTPQSRPETFDYVFQSWDTANKVSELSDYSVCTTWGKKGKDLYLLHVYRKKMDYPTLKRAVVEQALLWSARLVVIEDKASGTQLIQDLNHEGVYNIRSYQPDPNQDKAMRMYTCCNIFENGFVYLPEKADWLTDYRNELTVFPNGKHDDQVDSTSQALDWIKRVYLESQRNTVTFSTVSL